MGRTFTAQEPKFKNIPEETIVRGKLMEIKEDHRSGTSTRTGKPYDFKKLIWWFEVQSDDYLKDDGTKRRIKGETSNSFEVGSLFHQWAETLLGRDIPIGLGVDLEDLIGLPADITIRHEADRKDPAKKWERVDMVMPADASSTDIPF